MQSILELFHNEVPKKVKVKKNFNYSKNYNALIFVKIQKDILENIYYDKKTINNLSKFLKSNINYNKITDVKTYVFYILKIINLLDNKQKRLNSDLKEEFEKINMLKNNLNMILLDISNHTNLDLEDLIKKTYFEKITQDILTKQDICLLLSKIYNNIEIINYHSFNNEKFDSILYKKYIKAIKDKNEEELKYLYDFLRYSLLIKNLDIDKKIYEMILKTDIIEKTDYITCQSPLDKKMKKLDYNYKKGRYDLTEDFTFTLDNNNTKRFDDALSIEEVDDKYIIGIHTADIYSLNYNSNILNQKKPLSIPKGSGKASLNKNNVNNAITILIQMDKKGIVEDYKIIPSKIYVSQNILQKDIDDICFGRNNKNEKFNKDKKIILDKISKLLNVYLILENDKMPSYPINTNLANLITQKLMLLTGCIVSSFFFENKYPYLYLNGSFKECEYSTVNMGFDSGFEYFDSYGKVTSPIINKASSISQFLIYKCYFKRPKDKDLENYEKSLKLCAKELNKKH